MDSFPSYADLVSLVATLAFFLGYGAAVSRLAWRARRGPHAFTLLDVGRALLVGFCGSALSLLVLCFLFKSGSRL